MGDLKQYVLYRIIGKTGKIETTLVGRGKAMLKLWALQNTPKGKETIIVDSESGNIIVWMTNPKGDFPNVEESDCICHCSEINLPLEIVREALND